MDYREDMLGKDKEIKRKRDKTAGEEEDDAEKEDNKDQLITKEM